MEEVLVQMKNVLKILNSNQALLESIRTNVCGISVENRPIIQPATEVTDLIKPECNEAMASLAKRHLEPCLLRLS